MPSKYLILGVEHPAEVVENFANSIRVALESIGYKSRVLLLPRDGAALWEEISVGVAGTIALGPVPLHFTIDGILLHRYLKCPVAMYCLDPIIYDYLRSPVMPIYVADAKNDERLSIINPENSYLSLLGKNPISSVFPANTSFVPFGCFPELALPTPEPMERICVVGTIGNELGGRDQGEELQDWIPRIIPKSFPKQKCMELVDLLESHECPAVIAEAVQKIAQWDCLELFQPQELAFVCAVDSYMKRKRRINAIESASTTPIDFYGEGWEIRFGNRKNFRFFSSVRHSEIAATIARYKGVLNFDPNWDHGFHDRVYTACAMNVICVTNENKSRQEQDLPGNLLYTYNANNPNLEEIIEKIVREPAMSLAGPNFAVIKAHSWTNRIFSLLKN